LHHHTVEQVASWGRRHFVFAAIFLLLMMVGEGWLALTSYDMTIAFAWDASLWVDGAFVLAVLKECFRRKPKLEQDAAARRLE
jgi:hypothetical protein